jgi:hypothetical protein
VFGGFLTFTKDVSGGCVEPTCLPPPPPASSLLLVAVIIWLQSMAMRAQAGA